MVECDVCFESFKHWYQVSGYGCCNGLYCRDCKAKLTDCPSCRAGVIEKKVVCSICAIKKCDSDCCSGQQKYDACIEKAADIFDAVLEGDCCHRLPYCEIHKSQIIEAARKLGLNHEMSALNGHEFTENFGYYRCLKCEGIIMTSGTVNLCTCP